jgi:hypothetical protein
MGREARLAMTPVAPVRSKVSLHVKRARATSAWASVRCDYADRGSGYTGPYGLGGEALFGCSLTAVLRTRETFKTEVRNRRRLLLLLGTARAVCRGHPLGVARTRTTRAVADGSTVPLFLCTESFRELSLMSKKLLKEHSPARNQLPWKTHEKTQKTQKL